MQLLHIAFLHLHMPKHKFHIVENSTKTGFLIDLEAAYNELEARADVKEIKGHQFSTATKWDDIDCYSCLIHYILIDTE